MPTMKVIKKFALLGGTAITMSALYLSPLRADDATVYLQQIAQNTTNILTNVSTLPNYIATMVTYALNMQKNDDSKSTQSMQSNFALTGNSIVQDASAQLAAQPAMNQDLFGPDANSTTLQNANDLVYSTLLGQPLYNPDPRNPPGKPATANPPYNYIKNAAGMSIPHIFPRMNWRGSATDFAKYSTYYNTIMSIESFSGYVLSNQLAELQNSNALTTAQMTLVTQASSSDWIAQIASQEIGKVLRQLLMFESQTYVLMTQALQIQKQLLTAQVMTNALLIANNQSNESMMLAKAQGIKPTA
jgi:hypothetical protein